MKKYLLVLSLLLLPGTTLAAHVNCMGAYVGRINISAEKGLQNVVFIANHQNGSGSYWVAFTDWDDGAKKEALSVLMAAKLAKHRVDVYTHAADACSIGYPGQVLKNIMLSNNA